MENLKCKFLLVTANIGSLFEEYGSELQANWISSFQQLVATEKPLFIALHLQEVGGKTESQIKDDIHSYFDAIMNSALLEEYTCNCSYVDEETNDNSKYTALGCSYFIHKSLKDVEQWNFNDNCFCPISGKRELSGITNDLGSIRKIKFPLSCYSKNMERLPRKGFTLVRWKICNEVFDLLNIHLTHDACNINCTLTSPTKYSEDRKRALEFVFNILKENPSKHQILFGDFNVRPDTKQLVGYLMENVARQHLHEDEEGNPSSIVYKSLNGSSLDLLKIKSRFFELSNYDAFITSKVADVLRFDKELQWLKDKGQYRELDIKFQPTYPHKENPKDNDMLFASVRCPAWCDRIVMDSELFDKISHESETCYDSSGHSVCLGDHKPVFLTFTYHHVPNVE